MELAETLEEGEQEAGIGETEPAEEATKPGELPVSKQIDPPQTASGKLPLIQPPAYPQYKTAALQKGKRPEKFFEWWASLPEWACSRITVYIYRYWPVCQTIDPKNSKRTNLQQDKLLGTERLTSVDEMMRRYGSGDYGIWMNDSGMPKGSKKTLCTCMISTDHNFDDYPPVIPDMEKLVKTDPKNASYITWLGIKGIQVPGLETKKARQQEEEEEGDNVVNAHLTTALGNMTDKVIDMATKQAEQRPKESAPAASQETNGMNIITQAANLGTQLIANAAAKSAEIANKNGDPLEQVGKILEFVRSTMPPPAAPHEKGEDPTIAGMTLAIKMMETMQKMQPPPPPPVVAPERKSFLEEFKEQKEIFDLMGDSKKRKSDDDEDDEDKEKETTLDKAMKFAPMVISGLTSVFQLWANISHNNAAARAGEVIPPPPVTATAVGPQLVPSQEDQMAAQQREQIMAFMQQIEAPFISHFFGDSTDGTTFASFLISGGHGAGPTIDGRRNYEGLKQMGFDTIKSMLLSYHPIASMVQGTPDKLNKFLSDFLNFDAIMAEEDEEDDPKGA